MITTQLSSRRQVLCAVAAFFGLILAVLVGSSTLFETNADLQSQFDTKSRILDSLRDKALPQSAIDGKTAGLTPQSTATSALTETIAASELQKTIVGSLERAGGAVHSIQAAATTNSIGNGLRRLNAQINFDGSTDTLQKFLFYLETALPFIFVDFISIEVAQTSTPGADLAPMLRVTLVASSYWKSLDEHAMSR